MAISYKVGIGYDIHRLVKGRKLYLGGVHILYPRGLLGYSDADVLLHALCDALLGAMVAGDIGELFPDTEQRFKGISSLVLLKKVSGMVREKKYRIGNIDATIIAEEPNLMSYKGKIQEIVCRALHVKKDRVSIKAKTNEGLGDIGRKKAIAAWVAVILIQGG